MIMIRVSGGRHIAELDNSLLKQRPPNEFSRPPRSIRQHLSYWKASELKFWLLFYSLLLLIEKLPRLFRHHFAHFVCAMHILLKRSVSEEEIESTAIWNKVLFTQCTYGYLFVQICEEMGSTLDSFSFWI